VAEKSVADSLAGARRALKRAAAGEALSEKNFDVVDLRRIEGYLKLKRGSLTAYAPRTQRRYLAAISQQKTAGIQSSQEYAQRKARTFNKWHMTPNQYRKFAPIRNAILSSNVDINDMLDDDPIRDIVDMYGFKYVIDVLSQQLDSIKEYTAGNAGPGNRRWHSRGELEADAQARMKSSFAVYYANGTDPYYYYHGYLK
jgi:hypothetical protein